MKLLIKDFKSKKAQKNHVCTLCLLDITKGSTYKKCDSLGYNIKLHSVCYNSLSLDLTIKLLSDLKS